VKAQQPVRRSDLAHKIQACHRVEDAQWQKLQTLGCTEQSSAADIRLALVSVRRECPSWCEPAAWERIADTFATWATIFNSLQLFWRLRRKRDD
jgi:hypothetical protein